MRSAPSSIEGGIVLMRRDYFTKMFLLTPCSFVI